MSSPRDAGENLNDRGRYPVLRNRVLSLAAIILVLLLALWLVLARAEARLGGLIRLVYIHGALVFVAMALFTLSGVLGMLALLTRRSVWLRGTQAAGTTALIVWIAYVISAMAVTGLTWGQIIAWNEPRVRVSALILAVAVLAEVSIRLVNLRSFTSLAHVLMGIVTWLAVRQAGVIRHPVDPIGSSGSTAIQTYYVLVVLTVAGLAAILLSWLCIRAGPVAPDSVRGARSDRTESPPAELT